jgi:hypothetical protein
MGGRSDPRFDYVVVPGMTIGLFLSLIAVALSIAQFVVQLQNNEGTVTGIKEVFSNTTTHADSPVLTFCSPIPFNEEKTRCLFYENGLRPVKRGSQFQNPGPIPIHKLEYGLDWCNGDTDESADAETRNDLIFHVIYATLDGEKVVDNAGNPVLVNYETNGIVETDRKRELYYCVSFANSIVPAYLGGGAAKRTFFELAHASEYDFENYILKIWDPTELRTPRQALIKLSEEPLTLYEGKTLALPYSMAGTALFTTWVAPFDGPELPEGLHYGAFTAGSPQYGPVAVRAGISAVIEIMEEGTQSLKQDLPVYYYDISLKSLSPEIEYPYTDTSKYVTLAFVWNDDDTFYYQNVLQISNVGMAALLITTVAGFIIGISDGMAIYLDYEERNEKS